MTLKAAVIYIQGSGGNLLTRGLTLAEDTIPYVHEDLCEQQPTLNIAAEERLSLYDNWDWKNWKESEKLALWYRFGKNDFVNYENSPLHMVAQFHCQEFETENEQSVLWSSLEQWQNFIFITFDSDSMPVIAELAKRKRPDLAHYEQIWSKELDCFARLSHAVPGAITIKWEHMLETHRYVDMILDLADRLSLAPIDENHVRQLHQSWLYNTNQVLAMSELQNGL